MRSRVLALVLVAAGMVACHGARSVEILTPATVAAPVPAPSAEIAALWPATAPHADPSLLARKLLFAKVDRVSVKISPDGKRIGWLGPVQGVLNVWVAPADDVKKAQPVTQITGEDIHSWWWAMSSDRVLFTHDKGGDDSLHLYAVDLKKSETKDLTPIEGVFAELVALSPKRPKEAIVGIEEPGKKVHDAYLVDLTTGTRKLAATNDGGFAAWTADDDLRVRYATRRNADASVDLLQPNPLGKEKWTVFQHVGPGDALSVRPVDFDKTGNALYLEDSRNRDVSGLFSVDTKTGAETLLAENAKTDVGEVLMHPVNKTVEAVLFDYDRPTWKVVDASVEGDFYYLQTFGDGTLLVTSRSLDEQHWLVAYAHGDGATHYYLYDRDQDIPGNPGKATFLFTGQEGLERAKLSSVNPVIVKARDGLELVSYLTLPPASDPRAEGRPLSPLPMVLWVHDGPAARASLEYSPEQQLLASRGYAVLSVNYRGSAGFGPKFLNAGNLEWGGKMNDDLVDAVRWAVEQKIADPSKVAVVGAGYGGYAALNGMATSPGTFACGIDLGGPANLPAFVQTAQPGAQREPERLTLQVGDWRTDDGKKLLADRSPGTHVDGIKSPLLIGQAKDDPRVREADTAAFVAALKAKRVPVTYAVFADEDHGLDDLANRTSFGVLTEIFLAQCLGGPFQPIGEDIAGSTMTVPVGAHHIYGLRDAMGVTRPATGR
ncbi:MAG TPA: alpha/beta fold hydrolase [Polyangiaceae bacterium]|jgi:dipeptidyl aminopeptidase/acylaminoacyl peptidase|nr:alpha/beta fold hydrolase [Polyangiaceae bacterium]